MDHFEPYLFLCLAFFTIICTAWKPAFYWESSKARNMRSLLGDQGAALLYYAIGGFMLFAAFRLL